MIRWRDNISDLAWHCLGAEPAEISEIAENCEVQVFRVLLGLLSHDPAQGKSGFENEGINNKFFSKHRSY